MDSRLYEVEYNDGHTSSLASNSIEKNLFTQVDQSGKQFTVINLVTGTRIYGTQVLQQDPFMNTSTDTKRRVNTTKGW